MIYVFDSGPLIDIFNHFYPSRFPTFWDNFNEYLFLERIISVREVQNELIHYNDILSDWVRQNKKYFLEPNEAEFEFVSEIFKLPHFLHNVKKKKQLQGMPVADPFVIAKAKIIDGTVVTTEVFKKNAAQIPNICEHFNVKYLNLEQFMEAEDWVF